MIRGLLGKIKSNYIFLKGLSPHHELLKYFSIDEEGLNINPRDEIIEEFFDRFKGSTISVEEAKKRGFYCKLYQYMLTVAAFTNYLNSLESVIRFIKMTN